MKEIRMTIDEAAKYFGRHPNTIRYWCINGTLIAAKCRVERNKYGQWSVFVPKSSWAPPSTLLSRPL